MREHAVEELNRFSWGLFFDPGTQTGVPAEPYEQALVAMAFSVAGFIFNLVTLGVRMQRSKRAACRSSCADSFSPISAIQRKRTSDRSCHSTH